MSAGEFLQHRSRQGRGVQSVPQRVLDAVIVPFGIEAGVRRTFPIFAQTDFVFCSEGNAAQGQFRCVAAQRIQRVFGSGASGAAGCQIKHRAAIVQRFEGGIQHAHGFANACGGLTQQLPALPADAKDLVHHGFLAGSVGGKRKGEWPDA